MAPPRTRKRRVFAVARLEAADTDRIEDVQLEAEGSDAVITWLNEDGRMVEGQGPVLLLQVHDEHMLMSLWDNERESPFFSVRLDRKGRVVDGEIDTAILPLLDRLTEVPADVEG